MTPGDILLTDQVAVVTGAGAGIGRGIAAGMAAFGADVVVADIDLARAQRTVTTVEETGRRALALEVDAADSDQVHAMVREAHRHFGRIDILVNNAGGVRQQDFAAQSERSIRRHIDLNLMSMLSATAAATPLMIDAGRGGSIVNVASIEALRAAPGFAVYAACKAAMINFTRSLALELADHRIRVNALAPDVIATPGIRGLVAGPVPEPLPDPPPAVAEGLRRYVPLGVEGSVDDCAAAAVFLSSRMGRFLTGITVPVDGGTWASGGWSRGARDSGWQVFEGQFG